MIAAVVLAAGAGSRFGSDKLMHPYRGKPLAAWIADALQDVNLRWRIAVVPAAGEDRARLFRARGYDVVVNDDAGRGMGSSLALGAARAAELDADALLVVLADMPHVGVDLLEALIELSAAHEVVATDADGVRRPPAVFSRSRFGALKLIGGDRGAKALLADAAVVTVNAATVRDVDTPEDLA